MPTDPVTEALLKETRMQARVGKAVTRLRGQVLLFEPLKPWVAKKGGKSLLTGLAAAIWNSMERPGVAPTTKPQTRDGSETFHFSLTTVTKSSPFSRLLTGDRERSAAAHESYIERDDAPEEYERAAAREHDARGIGRKSHLSEDLEIAIGGQAYIERPDAVETGKAAEALSMYGNLPETFSERLRFWEEVEAIEPQPQNHFLSVDRRVNPDHWDQLASDPNIPPELREAAELPLREIKDKFGDDPNKTVLVPTPLKIPEARGQAIYDYLRATEPDTGQHPASVAPGRGGHIQSRLIISLPHELSADDRLTLLKRFCDAMFRNLEATNRGKTKKVDVPFWAVVHKPEATSDDRNYHAHIVFSERPARLMKHPETGTLEWDFSIKEEKRDASRHLRVRYPYTQQKVRVFNANSWPKIARHTYATLANEMLLARGIKKKLDPRTYEAMGIDHEPIKRLKPNEYAKEKKGIETPKAEKSITVQWDRIISNLDQRFNKKTLRPAPWMERRFDTEIRRWKGFDHPAQYVLANARMRWRIASYNAKYLEAEAAAAAVVVEKVRSKLDAPGKSWVPKYPVIGQFIDYITDVHVIKIRERAAAHRVTQKAMEDYMSEMATVQGPIIGNPISKMIHETMPSVHPHKLKMLDNLTNISNQIIVRINNGEEPDISAMHRQARADAEAVRAAKAAAAGQEPAHQAEQPSPTPVTKRVVITPAAAPASLPTTNRTPFKDAGGGRVVVDTERVLFETRRKVREAEQRLAAQKYRSEQVAGLKDGGPRVTTSRLIDDRPTAPAPMPVTTRGPKVTAPGPAAPKQQPPKAAAPSAAPTKPAAPAATPAPAKAAASPAQQPQPTKTAEPVRTAAPQPQPAAEQKPAPQAAVAKPTPAPQPETSPTPKTQPAAPAIPVRTHHTATKIEAAASPTPTREKPLSASAPQKADEATVPDVKKDPPQPEPEPPPDPRAVAHRKKRRRAVFAKWNAERGRTR